MSERSDVMRAVLSGARPTDEQYREYYREFHAQQAAATENTLIHSLDDAGRNSYQRLADALDAGSLENALDVGCGNGPLLAEIVARNARISVSGIDLSPDEIERARARIPSANIGVLVAGDAAQMPFASAMFEAVTSHMMLMLVPSLDPVLAEIRRVLAASGRLTVLVPRRGEKETPVAELLRTIPEWVREVHPDFTPVNPGDPRAWDADLLRVALRDAGFMRVEMDDFDVSQPVDADGLWEQLARRYYIGSLPHSTQQHVRKRLKACIGVGRLDYTDPFRIVMAQS